jgi:hypothetical protein
MEPLTNAAKVDKNRLREEIKEKLKKEGKIQFGVMSYELETLCPIPYAPCPLTPPSPLWGEGKGEGKGEVEVETNDPEGPFGAKESGEGTQLAPAPAIINAIYDAIGVRFSSLPVTPEKVLEALHGKEKN